MILWRRGGIGISLLRGRCLIRRLGGRIRLRVRIGIVIRKILLILLANKKVDKVYYAKKMIRCKYKHRSNNSF